MDESGRNSSGGVDGDKRRRGGNNRFCRRNGSRNGSEHLEHEVDSHRGSRRRVRHSYLRDTAKGQEKVIESRQKK